jgi:hypothetical protein
VQSGAARAVEEKKMMYKRNREEIMAQRKADPRQQVVLTKDEMVTEILALFEQEKYWSKHDIMKQTNQSDKLVNEVLKELALMEAAGENKNKFYLRDEYKINTATKKSKK